MVDSTEVASLRERAERLQAIVASQARRAFVLELTGTPKAGKTSAIAALESFFKQCRYQVRVIRERAAECPLPMKGHFFFNSWTTASMMTEVLGNIDTPAQIIILDRGFFDSLVWLELQRRRGQVTEPEQIAFASFVTLDRWRTLTNVVGVARVTPERAIERENINRLLPRTGSVMTPSALSAFNEALGDVVREQRAKDAFKIIEFDANADGVLPFAVHVLNKLLPEIEHWADRLVAAVPRATLKALLSEQGCGSAARAAELWKKLRDSISLNRRSSFETTNSDWVQLVACGMPVHKGEVFVFARHKGDKKTSRYGEHTLWKACHLEVSEPPTLEEVERCLVKRIRTDLHLAIELNPELIGFAWDEMREPNHIGFLFRVPIDSDSVADSMREKEFRYGSAHPLSATFQRLDLLRSKLDRFEPWSVSFLQELSQ